MRAWWVSDVMTRDVATVTEATPYRRIVDVLAERRVSAVPVVDDLGRVVGIVTRGDLLRVHLRSDADIRDDVVQEVLRRVLAVRDGTVRVEVYDRLAVIRPVGHLAQRGSRTFTTNSFSVNG